MTTIEDSDKRLARKLGKKKPRECPSYMVTVRAVAAKRAQLIVDGKTPGEARAACKTAAELGELAFFGLP